ncbi:MAG TPA: DUF2868 domain-containing protein [Myxococcota bacterium]
MSALSRREAQEILAVKALEESHPDVPSPELRRLAGSEAGDPADREGWLARRAAHILQRVPRKYRALASLQVPPAWLAYPVVGLGFALGIATNTLGPSGRIHAFYNPTTLIIVWNLLAALLIVARHFAPSRPGGPLLEALAQLVVAGARARRRWQRTETEAPSDFEVRAAFVRDYQRAFADSILARAALLLSAGSLAFTAGVLAGMYLRGVAFGYNIVWQSTLVRSPEAALDLLRALFVPAFLLAPGSFPDVAVVEQLASADGAPAGPWIHCFALTALVYAVLPRLAVLVWQQWEVREADARIGLDLTDAYFETLFRGGRSAASAVDRMALEGFALDASQYAVLASLQAGLIENDLRARPRRWLPGRDTLPQRNRWYPAWKRVVEEGWRDAFPEEERPRFLELGSAEFAAAVASSRRTSNPFAVELIALELAAFEAYWPLEPVGRSWLRAWKPAALPHLSGEARSQFFGQVSELLTLPAEFLDALRRDLEATARQLEGYWLKLGLGIVPGVAVGGLTLGIAAPFIGGLMGGAMGLSGAAAVKAGLAALGGGALLGGLGTGAIAMRPGARSEAGLSPSQAMLSAVKIEVFLHSVVLPRDPQIFARIARRFEAVVAEYEAALHDLPVREGVTTKQVEQHEEAVRILKKAAARIATLAPS